MVLLPLIASLLLAQSAPLSPYEAEIRAAVQDTKDIYPVPPALVRAVMRQESAFRANAMSPVGAMGLMQVMPFWAPKFGLRREQLMDPATSVLVGTRILAATLQAYHGDIISTLVSYNCRTLPLGAPIPKNGETDVYVQRVLAYYEQYLAAEGKRVVTTKGLPAPPAREPDPFNRSK